MAVGLWVHDTTPALHGLGDWLTNAGRLTGLLAGYLLAVALLMMSRMPALDRGVGSDRLARWHAFLGRYSIGLLVAHMVLITWGYAVTAHTNVVAETGTLWSSYPDVLMATVGMGLLVLVGVFSARMARRRLAYETWFYVHLYTYLGLALSFAHTFATGVDFASNRVNRMLWAGLYIAATASVVWWRLVTPILLNRRLNARVHKVRYESSDVVSVVIRGDDIPALGARPGQYFRLRFLTRDGWWQSHPYSLSAAPRRELLRFTVKALGDSSRAVAKLRPGTRVWLSGPYGAVTADKRRGRGTLLLAGGIGVTPIRALAETLPVTRSDDVILLYRANTEHDLVLRDELQALAGRRGLTVRTLVGPPASAADVLVGNRLAAMVPDVSRRDVFLCGPPGFVCAAQEALRRARVPRAQVHSEQFALEG